MDTITLIYILISLTFGAAVTFFILKNKKTNTINNPEIDTQSLDNKELIGGYKQEIQEFKMQILNLEKQLKHALDNNTDELIQNQLIESENLKSKIKDTENKFAIENNRFISENTILQDKISKYEEKIIDLQEGIVTEKNETASKTSEIEELLDKIRILEKSNQELDSEKNQIATELKDKTVENKLQVDSLISENTKLQDQISNYDKKVKNLEEDIEDYEDDILSEKKKTATKIAENEELLDKIRNLEKSNQELNSEKNHIEAELRDKKEENKLQAESLSFIQEILTAEDLKTEEIADHRPIDNIVEYVKELKDLLSIDHQMLERWSIIEKKQWIRNKTTIAFVGEFSAGKTSIVNRILSQDNPNIPLLPVNTKATTAIPTYISRGQSTLYRFVSPDHVLKGISEITFNQISKEVLDQVKGASNLLSHFVMSYKNDNLEELSILDTPGFNSNDKKDAERTIEVINECDALFWVMDVNAGTINKSSIDLIRRHLKKPLYIVINKIDTKAKSEVKKVEKLMRETFKNAGISVEEFIYFSAKADPKDIMTPIKSIKCSNGKDSFTKNISDQLERLVKENEILLKTAKSQSDKGFTIVNNLTDQLVDALKELIQSCYDVSSIPKKKEKIFSKDRYEMSVDEAIIFFDILEDISEKQTENIVKIYDQQLDSLSTYQELLEVYYTRMDDLDNIKDLQSEFTNKITRLTQ